MGERITIQMDKDFYDWWQRSFTPHIREDEPVMLIAWRAWEECKKIYSLRPLGGKDETPT